MKNEGILITGGTGFIGAYIIRELIEKGYKKIRVLRRSSSDDRLLQAFSNHIEYVEGDVLDLPKIESALRDMHSVIHAAAVITFNPRQRAGMYHVNIEGTENMVNSSLHCGISRFLHVSSIAALGRPKQKRHLSEQTTWEKSRNNSHYAITKNKAEREVWRGVAEGLNAFAVNPSTVIGAGFWDRPAANIVSEMDKGVSFYPTGSTGFVDVRDVARMSVALLEKAIAGEKYVLNSANSEWKTFLDKLADALQAKKPTKALDGFTKKMAGLTGWLMTNVLRTTPLITNEIIRNVSCHYEYASAKSEASTDLSYTPLDTTIHDMVFAYRGPGKKWTGAGYVLNGKLEILFL